MLDNNELTPAAKIDPKNIDLEPPVANSSNQQSMHNLLQPEITKVRELSYVDEDQLYVDMGQELQTIITTLEKLQQQKTNDKSLLEMINILKPLYALFLNGPNIQSKQAEHNEQGALL